MLRPLFWLPMAVQHTTPNLNDLKQLFYCPSWFCALTEWFFAPSDLGGIRGISWTRTFKIVHSPVWYLGGVNQKAEFSWNMQRSKSQLLCFSSLSSHGDSGLPKVQKKKLPHLFKAWAQHCHFYHILLVKNLIPWLPSMTMSSVPHIGLCQNVNFLTSGPSYEMEFFLMLLIQTAKQISHPTRQQQNILLQGRFCPENDASVQTQRELIKVI